jgi:glycerol uptake facilitator-like aquaporin
MSASLPRRLLAEALGTALLVATVVGSGIMAERLADGNVALALLCNTMATGAILVVLVTVFAPISGAHLNPAVTAVFAWRRELRLADALPYVVAQCLGGIVGTVIAHLMFGLAPLAMGVHIRTGTGQWIGELVATFTLVLTILLGSRAAPKAVPWLVGLVITAAYWFTSSTSFANPAVTLARGLTTTFAGIAPIDVPAFVVAQFAGAAIAVAVARALTIPAADRPETKPAAPSP